MEIDYKKICRYSEDDHAYIAYAPEYPVLCADGETPVKAIEELDIVVKMWFEIAMEDGNDITVHQIRECEDRQLSSYDAASYILSKLKTVTTYQLQKWLYYCNAWTSVWYNKELIDAKFERFDDGPVDRDLYDLLRHKRDVTAQDIPIKHELSDNDKRIIDCIITAYGTLSGDELSKLTHSEDPWKNATRNQIITRKVMKEYYSTLI